jgi:2,3-bisphosphoglycerate-independent phosphoglycerate mutase
MRRKISLKHIVILCDGMSDLPCDELGGETPMSVANKPNMDSIAAVSEVGLVRTVPDSLPPGSDVANLSVLGYDPSMYYTGRSPFEAASMGIEMGADDVAIRCNLVTLSKEAHFQNTKMLSYCGDDIKTEQADEIIKLVNKQLGNDNLKFYTGIDYRHCLIWKNGKINLNLTPPHDIIGKDIADYITPANEGSHEILALMEKSYRLLQGKQANSIWLWGEGKKAALPTFKEKFGLSASMVSAVDLLKGIAKIAEMEVLYVKGATGYIDTNFVGKAQAAIDSLKNGKDLAYIHIEAPDECGHRGEVEGKVLAIELIDSLVLEPFLQAFEGEQIKILICPDHATPLSLRTHTHDPVPYLIYDSTKLQKGAEIFTEKTAAASGNFVEIGHTLMEKFLG